MTNYVASGTTLSGVTLSTGDTVTATSSGTTPGIVSASVFNGGTALISGGGLITTTTMSGISAGQTGSVTISSGGSATLDGVDGWTVNVLTGGSAVSLSAAYDPTSLLSGIINVSSGGIANSTVLSSGGVQNVSSGGNVTSTTISGGGIENVRSSGHASNTIILSGGNEIVSSGGSAVSAVVSSGGTETVLLGGVETAATVYNGGTFAVSGGTVTGNGFTASTLTLAGVSAGTSKTFSWTAATSNAGTSAVAAIGEIAVGDNFNVGGTINVSSGGSASNTQVRSGGIVNVFSSGVTIGDVISNSGTEKISSGGVASATIVSGGTENVSSGGVASGIFVSSGGGLNVSSGGSVVSTTVNSSGAETVLAGGKASATSVLGGGMETVSSGGTESGGVVNSGGTDLVLSGGVLSNVALSAGAILSVSGGTISGAGATLTLGAITAPTVVNWPASGGSSAVSGIGETVSAGGVITVLSGGFAGGSSYPSLNVNSGGSVVVSSGGVAGGYDPTINSGGLVTVASGGVYSVTTIGFLEAGGSLTVQSGGVESGVTVYGGGIFNLQAGGSAVSGSFQGSATQGAPLTVVAGATAIANTFTSNTETVFGLDSGGNVGAGAVQTISSGGVGSGVHITGSGQQIIASSGVASGTLVSSGGLEAISSGGLATSTTVSSGGSAVVSSGGSAVSMTVSSGGVEIVMNGGIASSSQVLSSGTEIVSSGGLESGAVVASGGLEVVYAGATLSNVTLSGGANLAEGGAVISSGTLTLQGLASTLTGVNVSSGSALPAVVTLFSGSVVSGATVVASSGGVISADTISSGGSAVVSSGGIARGASIGAGGSEVILAGGSGSTTTILNGGVETVSSGGVESGVIVSSGGIEYVLSGGTESGGTVSSGGTVEWVSGAVVSSLSTVPGGTFLVSAPIVSSGKTLTLAGGNGFFSWPASGGSAATADISGTILSGGEEIVSSGGTDTSGTVNSGGTISLGASGALSNVTFASGANLVASGGTVSGAGVSLTVAPFASLTVVNWPASGGVAQVTSAIAETVNSGGTIIVSSGGSVSGISEGIGGSLVVTSGGIASGGLAQGGSVSIGSGGSGVANQIENGGSLLVSGGTETSGLFAYANLGPTHVTVESGGITSKSTIQQGAVEIISAGGSSISATTDQLGSQFVLSGGSAVSATIAGLQVVSAGGFASATTLKSAFAGYPAILQDAGTVQGVTISGTGASAVVLSGGVENLAVVSSGGTEIISSGGTASGSIVNSGGTEALYIGAAFTNATFNLGANVALEGVISGAPPVVVSGLTSTLTGQNLASGATPSTITDVLSATVVSGGVVDVYSGGLISATTISTGGSAFVSSGGRTSGVTLAAGGSETILSSGSATSTTVGSGGILQVSAGGSAISGIVGTSGAAYVSSGGSALMTTLSSGGNLFVSSGGYASGTTVTAGGSETVAGTETYPGAGGAFGVQSGGVQTILAGGVVSADTVGVGGIQIVSSGGTVINPTSGTPIRGTQIFWVGANVTDFVSGGAHLEEAGLTVSGGVNVALKPFTSTTSVSVGTGGTTSNISDLLSATVLGGGTVTVSSGSTDTATTLNGGTEIVSSGGSAASGTVLNGGYERVLSGGHLLTSETIGSGGTVEFASGSVSSGATLAFSGTSGTVAFDSGTSATTPITGFQAGDQIALSAFSATVTSAGLTTSGLSITDGGQTFLVPNISFASGIASGGQLDGYQFVADTTTVNGATEQAVTVVAIQATVSIAGMAQEGQTLTANAAVAGDSDATFSYQWQSSTDGVTWNNITGATSSTYTPKETDESSYLQVSVTAQNGTSATSAATSAVVDAAPTIGTVSITGSPQEGQALTAVVTGQQADDTVGYQWQLNGNAISGATNSTYTPVETDEGGAITVVATVTNDNGVSTSATSAATSAVVDAAPTIGTVTISGTAQEGQALTAVVTGVQTDDTVSYQWQLNGSAINGATGATYTPVETDEGGTITVAATVTNDNSVKVSATSVATAAVIDAAPTIGTVTISGTAQEGQALTAVVTGQQADDTVGYQWQLNGTAISGATGATYTPVETDEGGTITVAATVTNDNGVKVSATSVATAAVIDAAPTIGTVTISGTAQEGQALTAVVTGVQTDDTVSYQWQLNGSAINGATGATYTPVETDEGGAITVAATVTNDNGVSTSAASAATSAVVDAAPKIGTVSISGTAQEGQALTAVVTGVQTDDTVSYQWQLNGSAINGATGATYAIQPADQGYSIDVVATATNDNGATISATSAPTGPVLGASISVTTPMITGTPQEGQTLTASATSNDANATISYQWFSSVDGYHTAIGSGASYTVKEGDEGATIEAVATATDTTDNATASATSSATSAVTDAAPTIGTVTISGTAQEGQALTAVVTGVQTDDTVGYQWQLNGSAINGATGATYAIQPADQGYSIDVVATATNDNGATISATSAPTGPVLGASISVTTPMITGTPQEGQTLTASATSNDANATISYQWFSSVDGYHTAIGSGASYTVKEGDEGATIEAVATATDTTDNATASATSSATSAVIDAAPTIGTVTISGTAQEGQALTAVVTGVQTDDTVGYQWQLNGNAISGATNSTYTPVETDEGGTITVAATVTNDNGVKVSATSVATAAVIDAAPTIGTVTISGTAQEGQALTAVVTGVQTDDTVGYQWQLNGTAISGATGATYTPVETDEGGTITVAATVTNDNGVSTSAASAATSAVVDAAPKIGTVSISGTAQEGQALTAVVTGVQTDDTVSYQWQLNGSAINGATGATYAIQPADQGYSIDVVATATNDNGATISATSAPTGPVLGASISVTTPMITGTPQEGQTLTASATSNDANATISYQWFSSVDGYHTAIGSGASYTVKEGDEGATIEAVATATDTTDNATASATSSATSAVTDAAPTIGTVTISGTAQEGQALTAVVTGVQTDDTVSYQWQLNGSAINGATGATYTPVETDEGGAITVVATVTNDNGVSTSATSAATSAVVDAAPTIGTVSISGTAQEGQALTAVVTGVQTDDTVSYQWQLNGTAISGATNSTYTPVEIDEGGTITVAATVTNDNGVSTSAASAATSAVVDAAPTIGTVTISGTAQEGQALTAVVTGQQADDTVGYQWQLNGTAISGATGATYTPVETDEGGAITVVATVTNDNGVKVSATSVATAAVIDAAPTIGTVTISGTAQEGQALTAVVTGQQADDTVGYQWQLNGTAISGATNSTYTPVETDEGGAITVVATVTNDNGVKVSATSVATAAVIDAAPTIGTVTISGTAQEGQTLTASATAGQTDNPVTYQWYSAGVAISGATSATYKVAEGDETEVITVVATATNDNSVKVSATSAATAAVKDAPATLSVTVIGTAQEGQTLTAVALDNSGDAVIKYQWQSSTNGITWTNIAGATAATYVVLEASETRRLRVIATSTDTDGGSATATSAATAAVLDAAPTVTMPVITGTAQEGKVLTASATSGQSDNPVTYQWFSSANSYTTAIGTGASYTVKEADEGATIEVVATATNGNGVKVSATSLATPPVVDAAPTVTTPTIRGTAREGNTLTASASAGQSDNTVTYQWFSSADGFTTAIGAGKTYVVQEGDEGSTIKVVATVTNGNSVPISATSVATAAVLDAAPTVTKPTIGGVTQDGQVLTAAASAGQSDNAVTYQWFSSANNYTTAIGSGATYTIQEGDEGHRIEVVATATNSNGVTVSRTSAATATVVEPAPTLSVNPAVTVAAGGSKALGIVVNGDSDDSLKVVISGVPNFETVTAAGATAVVTHQGATSTYTFNSLPTADWSNGLVVNSLNPAQPLVTNTFTVTASNTTPGEAATAPSKTIAVTDPPAGYGSTMLMAQYAAAGFQSEFGGGAGGFITTPTPEAVHSEPPSLTKPT